jgi:hypothetical protein
MARLQVSTLLPALLALSLPAAHAMASGQETVALGSLGETYQLKSGVYGELIPGGKAAAAGSHVLALEIQHAGQEPLRLLVPGTEEARAESAEYVYFEHASDTVYAFWDGWSGSHPMLKLASFTAGEWSEVIEVSRDPWSFKGGPQLAITRDTFELEGKDGGRRTVVRTILHIIWWEEATSGIVALYRPLLLIDGAYRGAGPVVVLNDLVNVGGGDAATAPLTLLRRPVILPSLDGSMAVLAFVDARSQKLVTLDLQVMPGLVGVLGEVIRAHIIETGNRLEPAALGDVIRAHIIETGARMNPLDLAFLADVIRAHIIETGNRLGPVALGDVIRAHIIETGIRLARDRRSGLTAESSSPVHLLTVSAPVPAPDGVSEEMLTSFIGLTPMAEFPLPLIGDGEAWIQASPDGKRLIVAWSDGATSLAFREATNGSGWSAARAIQLSTELPLAEALRLLGDRVGR